jgi:hypothetical protein
MKKAYVIPLVLPARRIYSKLHESLKLLNILPVSYIRMQKSVLINIRHTVRKSFGRTVNKKCFVSQTRTSLRTKTAVHKGNNNNNNNNSSQLARSFPLSSSNSRCIL